MDTSFNRRHANRRERCILSPHKLNSSKSYGAVKQILINSTNLWTPFYIIRASISKEVMLSNILQYFAVIENFHWIIHRGFKRISKFCKNILAEVFKNSVEGVADELFECVTILWRLALKELRYGFKTETIRCALMQIRKFPYMFLFM